MSKLFKSLWKACLVIGLTVSVLWCVGVLNVSINKPINSTSTHAEQTIIEQRETENQINIEKELLKDKYSTALSMVNKVSSEVEIITYTVSGEYSSSYNRKGKDDFVFFNNASITVKNSITCKLGIQNDNIKFKADKNGNVDITYNKDDIKIISTQIDNTTYNDNKDLLGKEYTKSELIAITENNIDNFKRDIINDNINIIQAENYLKEYYINIARSMNVRSVSFNGDNVIITGGVEFLNCTNVKLGHPNAELKKENVKYIILHGVSSECYDVSATNYITNLNRSDGDHIDNTKSATHFYVDDKNIVQALDLNKVSYNAGKEYNYQSISLEICMFTDTGKQLKAIENTKIILDILRKQFPQAKIITHSMCENTSKKCPEFVYSDNPDIKIMSEREFFDMLGC